MSLPKIRILLPPLIAALLPGLSQAGSAPVPGTILARSEVFVGGAEGPQGTPCYRIPTLIAAPDGSLLAFAEGRQTPHDPGSGYPITISVKRSTDLGRTWGTAHVLASDARFAYSDPRALVDHKAGKVLLFYTQWPVKLGFEEVPQGTGDSSSVLYFRASSDGGKTWAEPVNVNPALKNPTWYALNGVVGVGIQLSRQTPAQGSANGRLIFPACVKDPSGSYLNFSICSDDSGSTWHRGRAAAPDKGLTESDIAELTDGRLLLSARDDAKNGPSRLHYLSSDGGQTWSRTALGGIVVPPVDCGLVYLPALGGSGPGRVVVSGPLGDPVGSGHARHNLGLWTSADEGQSFPLVRQLTAGFAAYSQVIALPDGTLGIIYEEAPATRIVFLSCAAGR